MAPAPPAPQPLVRARSRATRVDDGATPPFRTPVTVPFLWEDAPGRPKPHNATEASSTVPVPADEGYAKARLVPLKLPPRLQQVPSAATDHSPSPHTVLQGAKRTASMRRAASFLRRTPSARGGIFPRRKADKKGGHAAAPDTSCSSPSPSSASSSSSSSFFGDDCGHGARRRPADGRAGTEEDEGANGSSVRITRFRRNRSLPSITTSHLWVSICKGVKQIAPWS